MTGLAVVLVAIGCGDLSHGLAGLPAGRSRAAAASLVTAFVALLGALATDHDGSDTVVIIVVTAVIGGAWQITRVITQDPRMPLAVLGLGWAAAVAIASTWESQGDGIWHEFVRESPLEVARHFDPATTALLIGVGVSLTATANSIVRLVLGVVIDGDPPTTRIRGGRIIGPLERVLVLGLVAAGEATTAALVVTAKSLLRYPELRADDAVDVHAVTEYVLIGSLVSWGLALGGALMVI